MVDLGIKLRELRTAKKLSQLQVAQRVGVSKSMISSYELSTRLPSYDVLIKLAAVYGVSTDYLFGIEKNRTINVDKLTDAQIALLGSMIDEMKSNK